MPAGPPSCQALIHSWPSSSAIPVIECGCPNVLATPVSVTPFKFGIARPGQLHSTLVFQGKDWGCWTRQGLGRMGPLGRPCCRIGPPPEPSWRGSQGSWPQASPAGEERLCTHRHRWSATRTTAVDHPAAQPFGLLESNMRADGSSGPPASVCQSCSADLTFAREVVERSGHWRCSCSTCGHGAAVTRCNVQVLQGLGTGVWPRCMCSIRPLCRIDTSWLMYFD